MSRSYRLPRSRHQPSPPSAECMIVEIEESSQVNSKDNKANHSRRPSRVFSVAPTPKPFFSRSLSYCNQKAGVNGRIKMRWKSGLRYSCVVTGPSPCMLTRVSFAARYIATPHQVLRPELPARSSIRPPLIFHERARLARMTPHFSSCPGTASSSLGALQQMPLSPLDSIRRGSSSA